MEIEQAAAQERLQEQEHVQRERHEPEPLERVGDPEAGEEVEEGQGAHHHRADEHVGEARAVGAGGSCGGLPPHHREHGGEGEQHEAGNEERGQVGPGQRRGCHHEAEEGPGQHQIPGPPSRAPLHSEELEEEGQGRGGQERPRSDGEPLPDVMAALGSGQAVEELGCREDEQVEGEEREEREGAGSRRTEQRGPGERQGDDGGEERCLVADVHWIES